jgi:hypothetical protein
VPATLLHPEAPPEISTRRSWSWLVGLVAAVGVLVAAWPLTSWQMRQSVAVESTGRMRCTGSTPVKVEGIPIPAYRLVPGMRCRITYKVTNGAPLTAHLVSASFQGLGPESGLGLRAVGPHLHAAPDGDTSVAVYDLDRDLKAGDSATFSIEAVFRPHSCDGRGSTIFVRKGPDVEVSFLNVSGTQMGNVTYALVGTEASSDCPGSTR